MKRSGLILVGLMALAGSTVLKADPVGPYGFYKITNNSSMDLSSQFSFTLTFDGTNALFRLENNGALASSIAQVYFDDRSGLLTGIVAFDAGPGVSFEQGAKPGNLPGGNEVGFFAVWSAGSTSKQGGVAANGINPGEWLVISLSVKPGTDLAALTAALDSGAIRLGLHIQALSDGESDGYVSKGREVPEPGSFLLLGLGLMGAAALRKRF